MKIRGALDVSAPQGNFVAQTTLHNKVLCTVGNIVDACADVTWDAGTGEIVEIRNTLEKFQPPAGYTPPCSTL